MLTKFVLAFGVFSYAIFGAMCAAFPDRFPGQAMGYDLSTNNPRIEVFSMYGGLQIGLGLFFLLALFRKAYVPSALLILTLVPGGLAIGRGLAIVAIGGEINTFHYFATSVEIATAILAWVALQGERRRSE